MVFANESFGDGGVGLAAEDACVLADIDKKRHPVVVATGCDTRAIASARTGSFIIGRNIFEDETKETTFS